VPENAITVTPPSETKTYVVGTVLTVTVTVPAGQSMEEGSLTCTTVGNVSVTLTPEQTTGGATPTKYRFIMPEGAVTLNAVFKALPTHVVTAAVVPNGTITVQPAAAAEGVVVHVDLTPNPGYRLKTDTMGYYLKAGEDVHYPLAVAGSNNGYQFTMPNVAVTVYAEFEKIPETPLLPNPKLSINQNRWDIYFNVPQELKQQVAGLQYNSRYVETTLLNAAGDVVLRQRSINAGINTSGESYYTLYRTAALQSGNYQLLLTVGDGNQTIPLGRQTISVGDYLVVMNVWSDRQNNCTAQTRRLNANVDFRGALASLDGITVELVRREGNNETVVASGIGEYEFRQKGTTAGAATANDQNFEEATSTIYHFDIPEGKLSVGSYDFRVTYSKKGVSYDRPNPINVTGKPAIVSYTYDETLQIFTIQTECMPAGDYATSYQCMSSGRQESRWLTTIVNEAGVGKLDVSGVDFIQDSSFAIYNTATPTNTQAPIDNLRIPTKIDGGNSNNTQWPLVVENALRYEGEIAESYSEYLLPLGTTAITLRREGLTGAGKLEINITPFGPNVQTETKTQTIPDLSKPIVLESITVEQGKKYQITLCDEKDNWLGYTSFQLTGFPVLSGKWHGDVTPFTGNTLSCPLYGTLNLTPEQRAKVEFRCMVNDQVVNLPVISFTDQLFELDMTQIPDQAIIIVEAILPISNSGSTDTGTTTPGTGTTTPAQPLQFNYSLRVYRQPEEAKLPTIAPIIPAAGATEFAVTYEGGRYPTADVTVNIYRIFNDKLQSVLKNKNIGRTDVTLTSAQLGLSAGNYLLYFSMGDKVISAQKVTLGNLQYTVTFYDWDGKQLGESQLVAPGADATAPTDPTRGGYAFTGWSGSYTKVSADMALVAQ
ncbi:MAG: InlB B-repeat-containing protein, partial [Oscillospiraceae bacterium]